jgi:surfeit locus 1 family protein
MSGAPEPAAPAGPVRAATVLPAGRRFRPRVLPTLAAIVAIVVCVAAGRWQQGRMEAKQVLRAQFDAAARAEPVAFANIEAGADWPTLRYRSVIATGVYLGVRQILIDNKVHAGLAGYHVVTPLAMDDGHVVLVDRGWIAQGASRAEIPAAVPPAGVVSVSGRLVLPTSGYIELRPEAPSGPVWQNLDPARLGAATGLAVLPVVLEATVAPVPDDGLVRDWPAPDFGIEQHRIYMMQWYAFALLAAILWGWFNCPHAAGAGDD